VAIVSDPIRYLDDPSASPGLRQLLGSAHHDGPSAADLARLAGKLGPLLVVTAPATAAAAAGGTSAAAATKATAVAGASGALKLAVVAAVGGTVIAAGSFQAGRKYEEQHAPPPRVVEKIVVAPAPAIEPKPEPIPVRPEPVEGRAVEDPPKKPLVQKKPQPPAPAPAPKLTEVELLEQAMTAMKSGDPKAALALTQRHEQEFASGALVQEREMLAIEALVKLGHRGDARLKADVFRQKYPTSSHLLRLDALVGR
jgi:hypothetical protein